MATKVDGAHIARAGGQRQNKTKRKNLHGAASIGQYVTQKFKRPTSNSLAHPFYHRHQRLPIVAANISFWDDRCFSKRDRSRTRCLFCGLRAVYLEDLITVLFTLYDYAVSTTYANVDMFSYVCISITTHSFLQKRRYCLKQTAGSFHFSFYPCGGNDDLGYEKARCSFLF
jgi:hypothetical protein